MVQTDTQAFSVTYGTGSSSGTLATDTLHIGPLSPSMTFGLATNVSDEFRAYPMDGILGIGRGAGTDGIAAPQIMDVLSSDHLIGAKLYGIYLSRNVDGLLDGELNLGEVNTDRFIGDLNYMECVDNDTGFWEIPLEDAGVDGQTVGLTGRTAIMDTGTSYILMPEDDALAIHEGIQGYTQDGETFFVPCDSTSVVQFHFNKQTYNISTADWKGEKVDSGLCRSNIVGRQTFSETQWLVGDVFLKNVYSVFDFDNSRVGLGIMGGEEATSSSTNASSASTSIPSSTATASDTTSTGSSSPSASKTPSPSGSRSGDTSATSAAAESQAQDQQGGGAGRASMSAIEILLAVASVVMFM
jgi:hypothetical protein